MTAILVSLVKARHAECKAAGAVIFQVPGGTPERRAALEASAAAGRALLAAWDALWKADPQGAARLGDELYPIGKD